MGDNYITENTNGDGTGVSGFLNKNQPQNINTSSTNINGNDTASINTSAADSNINNSVGIAYIQNRKQFPSEVLKKGVEGIEYTAYDTQEGTDEAAKNASSNYTNFMSEIKQGIFCDVIFPLNQILYGFTSGLKQVNNSKNSGDKSDINYGDDIDSSLRAKLSKGPPSKPKSSSTTDTNNTDSITIKGNKSGIWAYQNVDDYFKKFVEKASNAPGENTRYNQYLTQKNLGLVLNSLGKKGTVALNSVAEGQKTDLKKAQAEFNNVQAEFNDVNEAGEFIIQIVEKIASYGSYLTILEQELSKTPSDREGGLKNVNSKSDSSLRDCQDLINVASAIINQIYKLASNDDNSRKDILPVTQNIKLDWSTDPFSNTNTTSNSNTNTTNTTNLQKGNYASAVTDIKNAVKMAINPPPSATNNNQIIIESNSSSHSTSSPPPDNPSFLDPKGDKESSWDDWGEIFADPFFVPFIGIVPKFRRAFLSEKTEDGKVKMDLTGVIYRNNDKNAITTDEDKKLDNPNILKSILRDKEVLTSAIDFIASSYKEAVNLGFSNVIKGYLATDVTKDYDSEIKALDNPAEFLDNIGTDGLLGKNENESVLPEKLKTLRAEKLKLTNDFDISMIGDQAAIEEALKEFTLKSYEIQKQIAQCEYALAGDKPDEKQKAIKDFKNFLNDDFNAKDIEMLRESLKDKRERNYAKAGADAKSIAESDTYTGDNKNIQTAMGNKGFANMPAVLISQMAPQIISIVAQSSETRKAQEKGKGGYTSLGKSTTTQSKSGIDLNEEDSTATKTPNKKKIKRTKSASQVFDDIIRKGTLASNILSIVSPTASSLIDSLYTANKIDDAQRMLKDGLISAEDYNNNVEEIQNKTGIIKKALNISGYAKDVLSISSDIVDVVKSAGTIGKINKSLKTGHVRALKASKDFRARFDDKDNKDSNKEKVVDRLSQYSASKKDRAVYHNEDIGVNGIIGKMKRGPAKDYVKYIAGLSANTTTTRFNRNIKLLDIAKETIEIVDNTKDIAEKISGQEFKIGGNIVKKGTNLFNLLLDKFSDRYKSASPEKIARRNTIGHILSLPNFAVDEEAKAFLSSRGKKPISGGKLKSLTEHAKAYSLLQALDVDIPGFVSACENLGNNKQATKTVAGAADWLSYTPDKSTSSAYACQKGDVLDIILGGKSSNTIEESYKKNYIKSEKKNGHKQLLYKYNNVFMQKRNFMAKVAPEVATLRTKKLKYQIKLQSHAGDNDPIKDKLETKIKEIDKKLKEIVSKIRSYDNELKKIQNQMIKNTYGTEVGATETAFPKVEGDSWESALGLDFGVYYKKKDNVTKQYEKLTSAKQAAKDAGVNEGSIELDNTGQAPASKNRAQKKQGKP